MSCVWQQIGKPSTSYEPLAEVELQDIENNIRLYVSGSLPDLEVCKMILIVVFVWVWPIHSWIQLGSIMWIVVFHQTKYLTHWRLLELSSAK